MNMDIDRRVCLVCGRVLCSPQACRSHCLSIHKRPCTHPYTPMLRDTRPAAPTKEAPAMTDETMDTVVNAVAIGPLKEKTEKELRHLVRASLYQSRSVITLRMENTCRRAFSWMSTLIKWCRQTARRFGPSSMVH